MWILKGSVQRTAKTDFAQFYPLFCSYCCGFRHCKCTWTAVRRNLNQGDQPRVTWDQKQPQQKVNWNPIKSVFILVFEQFYSDVFEIEDGHNSDDAIDNYPFVILSLR